MNQDVLNSWKEIAAYLGRGVRTVQRWERELDLPVRRPRAKDRSAVLALKPELDQWLKRGHTAHQRVDKPSLDHERLRKSTDLLISRANELLSRSQKLRDQVALAVSLGATLSKNRRELEGFRVQVREASKTGVDLARKIGGGRLKC